MRMNIKKFLWKPNAVTGYFWNECGRTMCVSHSGRWDYDSFISLFTTGFIYVDISTYIGFYLACFNVEFGLCTKRDVRRFGRDLGAATLRHIFLISNAYFIEHERIMKGFSPWANKLQYLSVRVGYALLRVWCVLIYLWTQGFNVALCYNWVYFSVIVINII